MRYEQTTLPVWSLLSGESGETLRHYMHTVPHLKPWQVVGRLVAPVQRWVGRHTLPAPPSALSDRLQPSVSMLRHHPWNARRRVLAGRFRFLGKEAALGCPVDWAAPQRSLLWRFFLHYFHYLHALAPQEQVALCRDWMAANPVGSDVGWHPYPTSLRLVNWCTAQLPAPDVRASLYRQAAYLSRTVETHVYGNHLLENARALLVAGCALRGQGEAPRWAAQGRALYRAEVEKQILADGFHYERSPMYHALMLHGVLDVLNVWPGGADAWPELQQRARAMTAALATVTHPDGRLALFNDAVHEVAPPPARLHRYAQSVVGECPPARSTLPSAGYYVVDADDVWLMIDGGAAGPEHLMAHAHADAFSYELSLFGDRFVVDSGVYEYAAGPMRDYVRSTAAHNTVQVDGHDQMECWDSFRVARRTAPRGVAWRRTPTGAFFKGELRLLEGGGVHQRRIRVEMEARRLSVHDMLAGTGTHRAESRIHLHPQVRVQCDGEGALLQRGTHRCRLVPTAGHLRREEGWYCPRFGERLRRPVLVVAAAGALPLRCGYEVRY